MVEVGRRVAGREGIDEVEIVEEVDHAVLVEISGTMNAYEVISAIEIEPASFSLQA